MRDSQHHNLTSFSRRAPGACGLFQRSIIRSSLAKTLTLVLSKTLPGAPKFPCRALGLVATGGGVGLVGQSGSSKTRIAYLLLEQHCMESRTIAAVPAREFVHLSQGQFRNNGENGFNRKLKQWESVDLLLVDGLDRVTKWSERTEGDLAGLLECRHERKRSVIWTTNAPSEHLWSRFPRGRQSPVATTLTQSTQIWAG